MKLLTYRMNTYSDASDAHFQGATYIVAEDVIFDKNLPKLVWNAQQTAHSLGEGICAFLLREDGTHYDFENLSFDSLGEVEQEVSCLFHQGVMTSDDGLKRVTELFIDIENHAQKVSKAKGNIENYLTELSSEMVNNYDKAVIAELINHMNDYDSSDLVVD